MIRSASQRTSHGGTGIFSIHPDAAGAFSGILVGWNMGQLGKGDVGRGSNWTGTDGLGNPDAGIPGVIRLINALRY
jgi:hypothetical protein